MDPLNLNEWRWLEKVSSSRPAATALPKASIQRLLAMNLIVGRFDKSFAVTGIGRDALLRRKYSLEPL